MAGPVSGSNYTFTLSLFSQSTGNVIQNPTIAAGDFNISTDGGALTPLSATPTVTPANSYIVEFNLTSEEVGTDHFTVVCVDAAGSEWKDVVFHETVQAKNDTVDVDAIADGVWDEPYASHTAAGTFGKLMDLLRKANRAIDGGVSGTPTTTAFDTNITGYTTGAFDSEVLVFVSGALEGEARPILSYSETDGRITFEEPWTAAPSASDEFVILPYHVHPVSEIVDGVWSEAQAGYTTDGTFGYYLDAKVSESGGGGGLAILDAELSSVTEVVLYAELNSIKYEAELVQ